VSVEPHVGIELRGPEALDHHVGAGDEGLDLGIAGSSDHRAHPVVEELEQRTAELGIDVGAAGRPRTPRITAGRFDLDHVGARVAEQAGRVPAGDAGAEVDDAQRRQTRAHRLRRGGSTAA
jgi:hypothetical protein